jgi:hypothetical protein
MLKRLSALLIALLIFFSLNTFADAAKRSNVYKKAGSNVYVASETIAGIAYDIYDGKLYIYTEKKIDGSFWLIDTKLKKGETYNQVHNRLKGLKVNIYYKMIDGEAEIIVIKVVGHS